MLCSELHEQEPEGEAEQRERSILRRIEAFQKDHFAVWENGGYGWNICFPLIDGAQVYGLSFLGDPTLKTIPPRLFLECSATAANLRKILTRA